MLSYSDIQRFQKLVQLDSGPKQAQLLQGATRQTI
jgi:hypothetical protein